MLFLGGHLRLHTLAEHAELQQLTLKHMVAFFSPGEVARFPLDLQRFKKDGIFLLSLVILSRCEFGGISNKETKLTILIN